MELNLPNELIRLIQEFVMSNKISWRAEYHFHKLTTKFKEKKINTNWTIERKTHYLIWERREIQKTLTFNSYQYDYVINKMHTAVKEYYSPLLQYLIHYKKKIFISIWKHGLCYVLGEKYQGTLCQELYFNQLRAVAQNHVEYAHHIKEWNGCLAKEDYISMCLLQKYI
jgi:hypothetical protein